MAAADASAYAPAVSRRRGRPTRAEAASLDEDVRAAALRMFLELGYEGTSMDAIAAAAGTTKASLYARFPGKENVFIAVLGWALRRPDWPVPEAEMPDPDGDLRTVLTAVAEAGLRRALHPSMVQLSRIAVAQAERFPELAQRTQSVGMWPKHQFVAEVLRRHAATGEIVADQPEVLAEHFMAMATAMPARLASFGIDRAPADQRERLSSAVELFVRGLRPD